MTMEKKTAAVIFGGQSSEHVVSCMSAANVIDRINTDKYNLILIGITQEGKWLKVDSVQAIRDESWRKGTVSAAILPDAEKKCALFMENGTMTEVKLDVVFPVLHGLCGEDGTIQGLLELAKIPYVGCGVLASAVSMDKLYTKIIVDELGIRQAAYVPVMKEQLEFLLDAQERAVAQWSAANHHRAGTCTHTLPTAKAMYIPIQNEKEVKGILGIYLEERRKLQEFEYGLLIAMLNETGVKLQDTFH